MKRGFSIRLFLADGLPDGLRIAEKSNWVGRGLICPRVRYADVRTRPDFQKTGVYLLVGLSESLQLPKLYIGEGDPAGSRLDSHSLKKDFWTYLVLFVSKDDTLNKAHVQYLESRLIALAKQAKRCELDNISTPELPSLSEADTADTEGFLDELLLILPVLGISAFESPKATPPAATILTLKGKGLVARGYEATQGFVVLKGSQAQLTEVPSVAEYTPYIITLRKSLLSNGILVTKPDCLELTQDYQFDSPSTAASAMLGRNANGRIEWKTDSGTPLRDLQTAGSTVVPDDTN